MKVQLTAEHLWLAVWRRKDRGDLLGRERSGLVWYYQPHKLPKLLEDFTGADLGFLDAWAAERGFEREVPAP